MLETAPRQTCRYHQAATRAQADALRRAASRNHETCVIATREHRRGGKTYPATFEFVLFGASKLYGTSAERFNGELARLGMGVRDAD